MKNLFKYGLIILIGALLRYAIFTFEASITPINANIPDSMVMKITLTSFLTPLSLMPLLLILIIKRYKPQITSQMVVFSIGWWAIELLSELGIIYFLVK